MSPHSARTFSARIALLDAQIVDSDDLPVGRVDDVELEPNADGLKVVALLTGSQALGERLGGATGRVLAGISAQLRDDPGPTKLDPSLVREIEPFVKLERPLADLDGLAPFERWLGKNLIGQLPGAGDAIE